MGPDDMGREHGSCLTQPEAEAGRQEGRAAFQGWLARGKQFLPGWGERQAEEGGGSRQSKRAKSRSKREAGTFGELQVMGYGHGRGDR